VPRTATRALTAAFVANGLGLPSFLARLPERQRDLGLSDTALGATVVAAAVGALLASPFAGLAVRRFGSRPVTTVAGAASATTLWLAGAAPSAPALFVALLVIGAADAAMDTGMNANGAAYEVLAGRSVLHRLHAAWSLGALAAAGAAALAASVGVGLTVQLAAVGIVIGGLTWFAAAGLVSEEPRPTDSQPRRRPVHTLLVIGVATTAAAMLEGTMGDWSAVQADRLGLPLGAAPLGTAAFMGGMLAGRLRGDRRTDRHGPVIVLRQGMLVCAAGLLLGAPFGAPEFLAGVAVAGYGVSVFFPLAFSTAGRIGGGGGAAVVSLAARVGFIIEPLLVGAVSDAASLRVAFAGAAIVALALAGAAGRIVARP
jgi:MFS family permease